MSEGSSKKGISRFYGNIWVSFGLPAFGLIFPVIDKHILNEVVNNAIPHFDIFIILGTSIVAFIFYIKGEIEMLKIPSAIKDAKTAKENTSSLVIEMEKVKRKIENLNGSTGISTNYNLPSVKKMATTIRKERKNIRRICLTRYLDQDFKPISSIGKRASNEVREKHKKEFQQVVYSNKKLFKQFRKSIYEFLVGGGEVREIISSVKDFSKDSEFYSEKFKEKYEYEIIKNHPDNNPLLQNIILIEYQEELGKLPELWIGGGKSKAEDFRFHKTCAKGFVLDYIERFKVVIQRNKKEDIEA